MRIRRAGEDRLVGYGDEVKLGRVTRVKEQGHQIVAGMVKDEASYHLG